MFVDTFIRRPILASVCSLIIVLAGALAIPTMPVAQYPDVAPPQQEPASAVAGKRVAAPARRAAAARIKNRFNRMGYIPPGVTLKLW